LANIGLVLGCTLLLAAIPVQSNILKKELPILIGLSLLTGLFLYDGILSFWEGMILLIAIFPVMYYLVTSQKSAVALGEDLEIEGEDLIREMPRLHAVGWFLLGLIALIISSRILVMGAATTAEFFGVSTFVIGLTVIAIGTSLPELAASVISALKGHHDIALGNIVGSNIFNLLMVLSLPGIISPPDIGPIVFTRDYMFMMALTLILAAAIFIVIKQGKPALGRFTGMLLLLVYVIYYFGLGFTPH
jgi:cation:H+ antiporter